MRWLPLLLVALGACESPPDRLERTKGVDEIVLTEPVTFTDPKGRPVTIEPGLHHVTRDRDGVLALERRDRKLRIAATTARHEIEVPGPRVYLAGGEIAEERHIFLLREDHKVLEAVGMVGGGKAPKPYLLRPGGAGNLIVEDSRFEKAFRAVIDKRINVMEPKEDVTWVPGNSYTIRWVKNGDLNPQVRIDLFTNGNNKVRTIVDTAPNTGTYEWKAPAGLDRWEYRIVVSTKLDPDHLIKVQDFSEKFWVRAMPFTVGVAKSGDTYKITWKTAGPHPGPEALVQLVKGSDVFRVLELRAKLTAGAFVWTPAADIPVGEYRIRLVSTVDVAYAGSSAPFAFE